MKKNLLYLILILAITLAYCANPVAPKGGDKDTDPPVLDTLNSSENNQLFFSSDELIFKFDEWVKLDKPNTQIVISPPLLNTPAFEVKGKSVIVRLHEDEELRENTTYVINFGQSIKDITENNPLTGFKHVFSTGSFIDSLNFSAKVMDAYTGEPVEDCLVMLYENLQDSVIYKEKPYYFGYTSEFGVVEISNLKSGTFKLLALLDKNANFIRDLDTEEIGFSDSLIQINDTSFFQPAIRLFSKEEGFRIVETKTDQYGSVDIEFLSKIDSATAESLNDSISISYILDSDRLKIYYDGVVKQPFNIAYTLDSHADTIRIRPRDKKEWLKKNTLGLTNPSGSNKVLKVFKTDSIIISFNAPIDSLLPARWVLQDTASQALNHNIIKSVDDARKIIISSQWLEQDMQLTMFDSAAKDMYGRHNDSIGIKIQLDDLSNYTNLDLTILSFTKNQNYNLRLMRKEHEVFNQDITGIDSINLNLDMLIPETHVLQIIEDDNNNGEWDTGNYLSKIQPETIMFFEISGFRANWDLEKTIKLKENK